LQPFDDLERGLGALGLLDGDRSFGADFLDRLATSSPIVASLCADTFATCCFSRWLCTGRDCERSASITMWAARSRPCLRLIALAPAAMLRIPSATIAWARSVAVVVPSPTASPVRLAAPRSICAPKSSSGSGSENSFAMVTPSLQTIGFPPLFLDEHGPRFGSECDAHRIGDRGGAVKQLLASF
jgi:hypothetical protein